MWRISRVFNPSEYFTMTNHVRLIIGGARSGKSSLAEQVGVSLLEQGVVSNLVYLATAQVKDDEMKSRVQHHLATRDSRWQTVEEPWNIHKVIAACDAQTCILVDCLTLWLTYGLCEKTLELFNAQKQALLEALKLTQAQVILVSNEVGHGIVPLGELSRVFVDQSGWLNQDIAKLATRVDFVMAGCPLQIK